MKKCPNCTGATMEKYRFHQQEVDKCRECGGIWLELGELDGALSNADNGNDQVFLEERLGEQLGESTRYCCKCEQKLTRYHLMDGFQVEVDTCSRCFGVWLDHDELDKVTQSPAIAEALLELDKPIQKRTWLFQFLSQMPVEYNLKPNAIPWAMYALIVLNVLFFASYSLGLVGEDFAYNNFSLHSDQVSHGHQLWTLITHMYMHAGVMHLVGNMYFLYIIGDNLEDTLGRGKFILYYTICGLAAAVAQVLAEPNSFIPMVGASGAIAGLFGMYLLWFRNASLTLMIIIYQKKVSPFVFFAVWLAINIIGLYIADENADGVAYWAHIGGFVAGLIIGLVVKKQVFIENPLLAMLDSNEVKVKR